MSNDRPQGTPPGVPSLPEVQHASEAADTSAEDSAGGQSLPATIDIDLTATRASGEEAPALAPAPEVTSEPEITIEPEPEPKPEPEPYRDPLCAEQARHRSMCDCRGAARAPITQ